MGSLQETKNETGSIIISALLFVAVSSLFLTGLASIIRTQSIQLSQIQQTYEAKSMIKVTERLLEETGEDLEKSSSGLIVFENGKTEWEEISDGKYEIKATLHNDYSISSEIKINAFREREDHKGKKRLESPLS